MSTTDFTNPTICLFVLLSLFEPVTCDRPLIYSSSSSSSSSTSYSAAKVCNCPPQPVCPQSPQPSCSTYAHIPIPPPPPPPHPVLIPLPYVGGPDLSKVRAIPTAISRREASDGSWGNGLEEVTPDSFLSKPLSTTTIKLDQPDKVDYPDYEEQSEEGITHPVTTTTKAPKLKQFSNPGKTTKVERNGCGGPSCIELLRRLFSPIIQQVDPDPLKVIHKRSVPADDHQSGLTDPKCNSERLRLVIQSATGKDLATIKKNIQLLAEQRLQGRFNVICADDDFSYITNTEEFCQEIVGDKTCYVFKQINRATSRRLRKRKKFLVHRLLFN